MPLNPKQREAAKLLKANRRFLWYGGARSGKSYLTIYLQISLALRFPGSRHVAVRLHAVDIRASLWTETIPAVLQDLGLEVGKEFEQNIVQMSIMFSNGSALYCAGLDDRPDKVLGREYLTIYTNESDIPWEFVTKLRTRLSQRMDTPTRFFADLNPGSINHWTYRLFFQGLDPATLKPLMQSGFVKFQLNPYDNLSNISADYIESELEPLSGNARERFLLGEYQANSDIKVFTPTPYQWAEFEDWGRRVGWANVRLVAGLDLGYQDADAFNIIAWADTYRDTWLVYEHKMRRQDLDQLAESIKRAMLWAFDNIPNSEKSFQIFADSATLRYGTEGDSKKTAHQLHQTYGLPIQAAYKRDKKIAIEFLQTEVNNGFFHIPTNGEFFQETEKIVFTKQDDGSIIREIDDKAFHPDMMDAILYSYRFIMGANGAFKARLYEVGKKSVVKKTDVQQFLERMQSASSQEVW